MLSRSCVVALLALVLSTLGFAESGETLWLDRAHVLALPGETVALHFEVGALPDGARPILWIAPRIVFNAEYAPKVGMVLTVNGQQVGLDRLAVGKRAFTYPCRKSLPFTSSDKCIEAKGELRWVVRLDDNFVVGEGVRVGSDRFYIPDDVEPSWGIDLSGLLKTGANTVTLRNPRPVDNPIDPYCNPFPENPPIPMGALHARFVRIGLIDAKTVEAWNAQRTLPYGLRTRAFNIKSDAEFKRMRAYYSDAAARETERELSALFRFTQGKFELWRGNFIEAEALFGAGLLDDAVSVEAQQALFRKSLAQMRQGRAADARATVAHMAEAFPYSPWTHVAQREQLIVAWDRTGLPLVNWPAIAGGGSGPTHRGGRRGRRGRLGVCGRDRRLRSARDAAPAPLGPHGGADVL